MEKVFMFGTATSGINFTDREEETARLVRNFSNGINTFIISPRRWGKTSLVRKASGIVNQNSNHCVVVNIDAFLCRSEEEFYKLLSIEVIKQTSSKLEEWMAIARQFLSALSPRFHFGTDPVNDFSFSLDTANNSQYESDILNLPQRIAESKNIRIVISIDEFQQIAEFKDSKSFQKTLRSVWQLHDKVSYCLYGSKMHLMTALFSKQSMPFYKFGEVMFLAKISESDWISFICSRFDATGKHISKKLAQQISQSVDYHSSYVQQLSWLVWTKTENSASELGFNEGLTDLLNQNAMLYYNLIENLTSYQLNFLRALTSGVHSEFSSSEMLKRYNLGTSANVVRIKKSLENKEIIDISGKRVTLIDPVFGIWLKREFLK
ncbi:MAG: ATP-binding protein [Dysgonamonadaceae bacterium]|nr:ATP-binding protein [Dysgonamonadaceae bacterium]